MINEEEASEPTEEVPEISLHALTGVRTGDTMQVKTQVGGQELVALIDSGSTHNFLSEAAVRDLNMKVQPHIGLCVVVANGERMPCVGFSAGTPIAIESEDFAVDLCVIPLGGYDIVLGTQWLATLGPILWDFGQLSMSLWRHDHPITWHDVMHHLGARGFWANT